VALMDAPLIVGEGGDYYVNRVVPASQRARVIEALVAIVKANPQVAAVFTSDELGKTPLPTGSPQDWSLKERARASWDPVRSGDVVVLLERDITPIPEAMPGAYVATHGSAWDYDRRVPMLFWRRGMSNFEQPHPVETIDIAPTLAAILGLRVTDGAFDGRCLDLDGGAGNSCGS
jgi:arylsulfatase A-like enzyme